MRFRRLNLIILSAVFPLVMLLAFVTIRPLAGRQQANGNNTELGNEAEVRIASNANQVEDNAGLMPAIPSEPPIAAKISFGPLNGLGESVVTGAPGAVLPLANVLLTNVNTQHQDYVIAEADGSFTAKIFAPPGSFIMVKHGPDHKFWEGTEQGATQFGLTIFPSTTIYRPHTHSGGSDTLAFADAGAIGIDVNATPTSIDAAWTISGTVGPVSDLRPGNKITIEATIRLYSSAISSTTDVSAIKLNMGDSRPWLMLFDEFGVPMPPINQAGSPRLTPGGLPILDVKRPMIWNAISKQPVTWRYAGGNIIEGELSLNMILDEKMPPGIYRPVLGFEFTGVPAGSGWVAGFVIPFTFQNMEAALPPIVVKAPATPTVRERDTGQNDRLIWYLLMDIASLGTRGTGAQEDRTIFQPSSFVATQGAPFILSPVDYNGDPATYRLEPYLPMINYGRGTTPGPPLLTFDLPGGELCVSVHEPDGQQIDLGCDTIAQSVSGDRSTILGELLNFGSIEVSEYYGLTTTSEDYVVSFTKPGHHVIEMRGWVNDVWGNRYEGGGIYDVWVAHPLDIDPGLLPGTPLAVGDVVNPTVQLQPRLPARVELTIRHYPYSDPGREQIYSIGGWANRFGTFTSDSPPIVLNEPGEYHLDLTAQYLDPESGEAYMAAATWGGVAMTPAENAQLVGHGRRGIDTLNEVPGSWFVLCDLNPPENSTPHIFNTYLNGDVIWSRLDPADYEGACIGDALVLTASVQDTVGTVETAIRERFNRSDNLLYAPVPFEQRVQADELPLFSSTTSGLPVALAPEETDQIAYAYLSSQRPGARVRESVAEDGQSSGYWRFDGMFDNQPGVGLEGDLANDFKYQFVGIVYHDIVSGFSEYLGQGSGWIHLPVSDTTGSRVMPPFSGPGNGGWTTAGGPLMTLKGKDIHMFIMPTGVRPGAVLQVGERFDFAGHTMPTLDSRVEVEILAPGGVKRFVTGRASSVGTFYAPWDSFVLDEPGLWTATVRVWHDGQIGSGEHVNCVAADPFDPSLPCPSGDVLGSADGRYAFYVVPVDSPRLELTAPNPGRLLFGDEVAPIGITGTVPAGVTNPVVDYTISMPGFILEEGQAQIANGQFSLVFDPKALNADFPNLDLIGRHGQEVAGLADTFSFGFLLTGEKDGMGVYQATTLTIQGDQVYVENAVDVEFPHVYLPFVTAAD